MIGVGMLIGGGQDALPIHSAGFVGTGSSQNVSFTGAIAGDMAVVYVQPGLDVPAFNAAGGAAWTALQPFGTGVDDPYGYKSRVAFKVLNATDIANGHVRLTLQAGQPGWLGVYRGPTSAAVIQSAICSPDTATNLTLPAATLGANVAAVVIVTADRDGASATIAPPANAGGGITQKLANFDATGFFRINVWDYLAPSDYPEQSMNFTGFTSALYQWGHILELRK